MSDEDPIERQRDREEQPDDFYISSGLRDLPERAILEMQYITGMREVFHPDLRAFIEQTLELYSKRKQEEGGVDYTEDLAELVVNGGEEGEDEVEQEDEAAPLNDDDEAVRPASLEESDDEIIFEKVVIVDRLNAVEESEQVDPESGAQSSRDGAGTLQDEGLEIVESARPESPSSSSPVDQPTDRSPSPFQFEYAGEQQAAVAAAAAAVASAADVLSPSTRRSSGVPNPLADLFATNEDLDRVTRLTESMHIPSFKEIHADPKEEPDSPPPSSSKSAEPAAQSRKRLRPGSPHQPARPLATIAPSPARGCTESKAQLQEQQHRQSPLPSSLDELISEEARIILMNQARSNAVKTKLNTLFAHPQPQPPLPFVHSPPNLNPMAFPHPPHMPSIQQLPMPDTTWRNLNTSPSKQSSTSFSTVKRNCAFCDKSHASEECCQYLTFHERESKAKQCEMCWHCLQKFTKGICDVRGHRNACPRCPEFHHVAMCRRERGSYRE